MALIFVHGVNTRFGPEYQTEVASRNELLRRLLLVPLEEATHRPVAEMRIENVYWGQHGVTFAWNNACLPDVKTLKHMGGMDGSTPLADAELQRVAADLGGSSVQTGLTPMGGASFNLRAAALKDPMQVAEALLSPLLFAEKELEATSVGTPEERGRRQALAIVAAMEAAAAEQTKTALAAAANDQEVIEILKRATLDRLEQLSQPSPSTTGLTAMGGGLWQSFKDRVGEIFNRAKQAPARVTTVAALDVYRNALQEKLGLFLGDVFVYLHRRGSQAAPGPIVSTVRDAIATAPKKTPSEPTIVITHSMGGNIVYDLLTHYAPELSVDAWISVASQVGFFEEMKIFNASDSNITGPAKVGSLSTLKFWLNIYDPADVLAFKTEPIFSAAKRDLSFITGDSALKAHGAYFKRPSFYRLLFNELKTAPF